jgi:hypothetical protein
VISDGIHQDVSFEAYLSAEAFAAPAVSGSDLVAYETECPAHAHAFWRGNPARVHREPSASMALGTAAHCYILEGAEVFHQRFSVKPDGLSFATREGKQWREAQGDRQIVSFTDHMRIVGMRDGLMKNADARRLLEAGGRAEVTMVARDEETGLTLLCRPDLYIARAGLAVNLKTTATFRLVASTLGIQRPTHAFMVVGNDEPFIGYVAALSADAASAADQQLRQILRRFAKSVADDSWPGYTTGVIEIGLPQWAANEINASIQREYTK